MSVTSAYQICYKNNLHHSIMKYINSLSTKEVWNQNNQGCYKDDLKLMIHIHLLKYGHKVSTS